MGINELNEKPGIEQNVKLYKRFNQFNKLIAALNKKDLPSEATSAVNNYVHQINLITDFNEMECQIRNDQLSILRLLEKRYKIVPRHYYLMLWLALGFGAIGVPAGTIVGIILDNMIFLALGLPFGVIIGLIIGFYKDKKAKLIGKQLDFKIQY